MLIKINYDLRIVFYFGLKFTFNELQKPLNENLFRNIVNILKKVWV